MALKFQLSSFILNTGGVLVVDRESQVAIRNYNAKLRNIECSKDQVSLQQQ